SSLSKSRRIAQVAATDPRDLGSTGLRAGGAPSAPRWVDKRWRLYALAALRAAPGRDAGATHSTRRNERDADAEDAIEQQVRDQQRREHRAERHQRDTGGEDHAR